MSINRSCIFLTFGAFLFSISFITTCPAAVVATKYGKQEGRVIVRESTDRLVVTIATQDKRLFQFYAKDVDSITAEKKVLVSQSTWLLNDPADPASHSVELSPGMEVIIVEANDREGTAWLKVKGWGNTEGWIRQELLTDKVIFTDREKAIPLPGHAANGSIAPATAAIPESPTSEQADSK